VPVMFLFFARRPVEEVGPAPAAPLIEAHP